MLYWFVLYDAGGVEAFYVGETIHFATRLGQYCGMIRRLLLLHDAAPKVILEKHPMRHIQYHLAASLRDERHITLEWDALKSSVTKIEREHAEKETRQKLQQQHPHARAIAGRRNQNFETNCPNSLTPGWSTARARLLTCPNRRGKKPPFFV